MAYIQTTDTRSRSRQTPNYSQCLVRTHPSRTGPGYVFRHRYSVIVILYISSPITIGSVFWHLSSSAQLHSSVLKIVSFAKASAWTLAGWFDVSGHKVASNELKSCLRSRSMLPSSAMTVACRLASVDTLSRRELVCPLRGRVSVVCRDDTPDYLLEKCGVV